MSFAADPLPGDDRGDGEGAEVHEQVDGQIEQDGLGGDEGRVDAGVVNASRDGAEHVAGMGDGTVGEEAFDVVLRRRRRCCRRWQ